MSYEMSEPPTEVGAQRERASRHKRSTKVVAAALAGATVIAAGVVMLRLRSDSEKDGVAISQLHADIAAQTALNKQEIAANARTQTELEHLAGVVARSNTYQFSPGVVDGSSLRSITTLPAYGESGDQQNARLLAGATLELLKKPINSSQAWQPDCTVTKVAEDGHIYIMSAQHCFKLDENLPAHGGSLQLPEAINLTQRANTAYAIGEPALPPPSNYDPGNYSHVYRSIATVDNIAVDESGISDVALLEVDQRSASAQFNNTPSINLDNVVQSGQTYPTPGESVFLYSLPQSNLFQPVRETGVYLGDYTIQGGIASSYRLVAINPSTPEQDACNYGASGSSAVFANGQFSGPLSMRDNVGYGSDDYFMSPDIASTGEYFRLMIEQETGINLDNYSTICGYSGLVSEPQANVGYNGTLRDLEQVLADPSVVIFPTK